MQQGEHDAKRPAAPRLNYQMTLAALLGLAAGAPLAALIAMGGLRHALPAAAAAAGLAALGLAIIMLRSLRPVAQALAECLGDEADGQDWRGGNLPGQARRVAARVHELRRMSEGRHPVTGLATRESLLRSLAAPGADGAPGVLGVIRFEDYDGMAAFDPAAADRALRAFAGRLRASAAASRPVGQIDRDCFAIWFAGAHDLGEFQALAYVLSQELTDGDLRLTPRVALGAAVYPRDGDDLPALLTRAVAAISEAAHPAPGRTAMVSVTATAGARERFALEQEARRALSRNQFSLAYQPVVDVVNGRVAGAEALLRWKHPELGSVPPSEFVPMLEQSGLMEEVGLWVLNTACRTARAWRDEGHGDLTMAVNLSPMQCRDPQLPSLVMRTLERHGLASGQLELELTETAAMEDCDGTRQLLVQLRDLGVSVAIDDFGAGYSSLTYLKNLPFSKLKMDREFVTHLDERRDSQAICSALIALAKGLDIRILAEGVERREELETLRTLGCPLIQGYYFARPLAAGDFLPTITDPAWLTLLASPVHRQRALIDRRARQ